MTWYCSYPLQTNMDGTVLCFCFMNEKTFICIVRLKNIYIGNTLCTEVRHKSRSNVSYLQ
jgi:hypothetical protein